MPNIVELITQILISWGIGVTISQLISTITLLLATIIIALLADYLVRRIVLNSIKRIIGSTKILWDDALVHHKFFDRLAHIVPIVIIYGSSEIVFAQYGSLIALTQKLCISFIVLTCSLAINSFLNAATEVYESTRFSKDKPIKSYVQVVKIFFFLIVAIFIIATLLDRSPWALLSGLGAMTAISMLVFKDTILGFVASIQLSSNNMVRVGDWIEMPSFGADGDVISVSINTVKVQNWDKTISTIPTYALISDSFKNWRGMSESGGRRIKRSVMIDMSSIKFCDQELLEKLRKIQILRTYIENKLKELETYNKKNNIDDSVIVNGRRMTNFGTFRAYMIEYLRNLPKIHTGLTLLVRQLNPQPNGIPLEIYAFSNDQDWSNYEDLQSDIFDHIFAVVSEFDLRVFQNPSGRDYRYMIEGISKK